MSVVRTKLCPTLRFRKPSILRRRLCVILVTALVVLSGFSFGLFTAAKKGIFDPDVRGKLMVVYGSQNTIGTKVQGMFSEFASVVGALYYAEKHGAAGVRVEFYNSLYVDPARGPNWWLYFFEPPVMMVNPDRRGKRLHEVHFNKYLSRYGIFGSFTPILNGDSRPVALQPFPLPWPNCPTIEELGALVKRHIRVKQEHVDKVDAFWRANVPRGRFVLTVHYRGTDKGVGVYPFTAPPFEIFDFYVQTILRKYATGKQFSIFVATDQQEFLDYMINQYGDKVFYYRDSPKASKSDAASSTGVHKSNQFDPFRKGESALLDVLLLAKGNYLIKNRSSVSDASLLFNPQLPFTFILGPRDRIYASDGLPQPPEEFMKAWQTGAPLPALPALNLKPSKARQLITKRS